MKTRLKLLLTFGIVLATLACASEAAALLNAPSDLSVIAGIGALATLVLVVPTLLQILWRMK